MRLHIVMLGAFLLACGEVTATPPDAAAPVPDAAADAMGVVTCSGDEACDDGLFCNGIERCGSDGRCAPGTPPATAPGVTCSNGLLAAGEHHTCALLNSGALYCWGRGDSGRLGYGSTSNIGNLTTPIEAGPLRLDGGVVVQVAAGGLHTCALLANGSVRCWGLGSEGQLGYGNITTIGDDEPLAGTVNVSGTVARLAAGFFHTCALLDTGSVRCWGRGMEGQLGYGNVDRIGDDDPPAVAGDVDLGGTAVQIGAGSFHTCALLDTGSVRCWGLGSDGQLGYGNADSIGDDEAPAVAGDVNVGGKVTQIAVGAFHTCALLDTGSVRCWGLGIDGQLGYGNADSIGDDEAAFVAGDVFLGGASRAIQVAAGYDHTCVLREDSSVRCWGLGTDGQLGYGNATNIGDDEVPAVTGDVDVGGTVTQLTAGGAHTCAMLDTGAVRCWGLGVHGQLGYGSTFDIGDNEPPSSAGDVPLP